MSSEVAQISPTINNDPAENKALEIRDDLVNTAVKFLTNPKVVKTSLAEQQKFLRRKGLTDEEIRLACEQSGAYSLHEQSRALSQAPDQGPTLPQPYSNVVANHPNYGRSDVLFRIKEFIHNTAMLSLVVYALYKFYEKFIKPFLFGDKKKKKSIEEQVQDLDKDMKRQVMELQTNITDIVRIEIEKLGSQRHLSDLKSDVATVKGLLLNRSQFPQVSSKSSIVKPSIPAWQKTSISHDSDDSDAERIKGEDLSEVGSGSGSSEHEHNAKNSDSSLDIISFSSKDSDILKKKRSKNKSPKPEVDDEEDEEEGK